MTAVRRIATRLLDRLPPVRGRYAENAPLGSFTWFRVGGPAEVLFRPADRDDLAAFLAARPADVPVTMLGVGSNVLIRDGGIPGVVVRLGRAFAEIAAEGAAVIVGAAAPDVHVARVACAAGIAGLEFLAGIPGTIGGALRMNAGAFGSDMRAVVAWAEVLDEGGACRRLPVEDLEFGYRRCGVPARWIFVGARLHGTAADPAEVASRIADIRAIRDATQPTHVRTGGSTFANPPGTKAWQLIDAAGCRGLRRGDAQVSEKHCNFLINRGSASAADIEALGEEIRRRVLETSGVELEWEIHRMGVADAHGMREVM